MNVQNSQHVINNRRVERIQYRNILQYIVIQYVDN
jgi:hypothetical protein